MPVYNGERFVERAIKSVLSQTYKNFELIIIDDNSKDSTREIVSRYVDGKKVKLISQKKNGGVSSARNAGIFFATGSYLAFLDADDLWAEKKLEIQLKFMIKNKAKISYTSTSYISENGQMSDFILKAKRKIRLLDLLKGNDMSCSSVMVSSAVSCYFPSGYMHEDYANWMNILKQEKYAYGINLPLLQYRVVAGSKSSNRIKSAIMTLNSYLHVGFKLPVALMFTMQYFIYSVIKHKKISGGF